MLWYWEINKEIFEINILRKKFDANILVQKKSGNALFT